MEPQVLAATITAGGSVVASLIAAAAASLIGKRFLSQDRLKAQLAEAAADIEFLLEVEARHCELHQEISRQSNKRRVRAHAMAQGKKWSGKFTPGRFRSNAVD